MSAQAPGDAPRAGRSLLRSRRSRLLLLMLVSAAAITALAVYAAGPALTHWVTPEELAAREDVEGQRWRVGGRVVPQSIVEEAGRPVRFEIQGDTGARTLVNYDGVVPGLFGEMAFVIVEGTAVAPDEIDGYEVMIRHEDEFFSEMPPEDSISRYFVDGEYEPGDYEHGDDEPDSAEPSTDTE